MFSEEEEPEEPECSADIDCASDEACEDGGCVYWGGDLCDGYDGWGNHVPCEEDYLEEGYCYDVDGNVVLCGEEDEEDFGLCYDESGNLISCPDEYYGDDICYDGWGNEVDCEEEVECTDDSDCAIDEIWDMGECISTGGICYDGWGEIVDCEEEPEEPECYYNDDCNWDEECIMGECSPID